MQWRGVVISLCGEDGVLTSTERGRLIWGSTMSLRVLQRLFGGFKKICKLLELLRVVITSRR